IDTCMCRSMTCQSPRARDPICLDQALDELDRLSSQQRELVELKFFAGLTTKEIADILEVSARTVAREWTCAKAFLHARLSQ
ncbi:MAG: ECF-type sigma factor, partial [Wenzhouxiangella sp.]